MQALDLLLKRHSQPRLELPAPSGDALENIMQAALRAPDHASLKPWRFIVCEGEGLKKLGKIYHDAAIAQGNPDIDLARATQLTQRAPMVIVAIMQYKPHEKVPRVEQVSSAACAVQAMQMAALAQGFAGIWRTGSYAFYDEVKHALSLGKDDEIVGYLYLGTAATSSLPKAEVTSSDYFEFWK